MSCFLRADGEAGAGHPTPPPGGAAAGGVLHQVHLGASSQLVHHRGHEAGWLVIGDEPGSLFIIEGMKQVGW